MGDPKKFLERLHDGVVVGDGAMGTMLYSLGVPIQTNYDQLNVTRPELVIQLHAEYLAAGAQLLETNTFGANRTKLADFGLDSQVREINVRGASLARAVAGDRAFVAGSIGPLREAERPEADSFEAYREQAAALAEGGCDVLILETFADLGELETALRAARAACDLPVICQLAFLEQGKTAKGADAEDAAYRLPDLGASVVGANCGGGPARVLQALKRMARATSAPLSAFANSGFPTRVGDRFIYLANPSYFADTAREMVAAGASLVGGCCGTTPADIRAVAEAVRALKPGPRLVRPSVPAAPKPAPIAPARRPSFLDRVGRRPIVVAELDPPKHLDTAKVFEGAAELAALGVDAITMAENPLATIRMSNVVLAHLVQQRTGVRVICHITCRDRNLIGLQSHLMGADVLDVQYLLALTGDPARIGAQPGATSVYDLDSVGLIKLIATLNRGENMAGHSIKRSTHFLIGAGFNPNSKRIDHQIKRLEMKVKAGTQFVLTQPVYDAEKIRETYALTASIGVPIFIGVFPLLSAKNAEYLHNAVPG
ncbi:MAG: bifunctional homocysteine S-methyltransferase/methylenetetrahydrofolate reductase, partial [Planctomycetes bacterium]|nr:bifunctional homocysteine S-methyltransferase/methylenetetrahydrofolate reductase [Planctomycetota bacterium]